MSTSFVAAHQRDHVSSSAASMPSPSRSILMIPRSAQSSLSHWTIAAIVHRGRLDRDHLVETPRGDHDPPAVLAQVARHDPGSERTRSSQCRTSGDVGSIFASRRRARNSCWTSARGSSRSASAESFVRAAFAGAPPRHRGKVEAGDELRRCRPFASRSWPSTLPISRTARREPVGDHVGRHRRARVLAVLAEHVLDDPFPRWSPRGQIEVDVGPLAPLLREEALEEQLHAYRVDRRDPQRVADGAVGRGAAPLAEDVGDSHGRSEAMSSTIRK